MFFLEVLFSLQTYIKILDCCLRSAEKYDIEKNLAFSFVLISLYAIFATELYFSWFIFFGCHLVKWFQNWLVMGGLQLYVAILFGYIILSFI